MSAHSQTQPRTLPLKITPAHCSGRTFIVTGANVGLGLEASRHLVAIGASKVIMAVRNLSAGASALADIEQSTGITGVGEVWALDLSSHASVKEFVERAKTLGRIEGVIENAGVASPAGVAEGRKLCLTVNVVSTLLLAVLLLPKLRADAEREGYEPRVSLVTSNTGLDMGAYWETVKEDPIEMIDGDENIAMTAIYPISKLLEILAVREMARLLPVDQGKVIFNTVNPGICETTLSRNAPQAFKDHLKELWEKCGRTPEVGSRTILAGGVAGRESHGAYMNDCVPANELLPEWVNPTADKQAWDSVVKELEKIEPGCVERAFG